MVLTLRCSQFVYKEQKPKTKEINMQLDVFRIQKSCSREKITSILNEEPDKYIKIV